MAKATVKLLQPVIAPVESVTLTLNLNEINTLMFILRRIGGDPAFTPRKHADSIVQAINSALLDSNVNLVIPDFPLDENPNGRNNIYFK